MEYNDKQFEIIKTAEKLFSAKGYDGTSVRDIADEAGINIAMISYYFGSKEKLMEAIFAQRTSQLTQKIEELLKDEALAPFQKLEVLIDDYVERVMTRERFYKLMICEQMMEKNLPIIEMLNGLKQRNTELIERLVKDGEQKNAFKKGTDTLLLMNTLIGTVMQSFMNREQYKIHHGLQQMPADEFAQLIKLKISTHIKGLFKAILVYEQ